MHIISDKAVCTAIYPSDICVTQGTAAARQKSSSALFMPAYTKTKTDFPA
jgi:hypothetical protein